ncbi:DUF1842 domain-containing protein [Microscilla marina]|uniref:DUF1842 domain-containing protein n=1 Tax=Microscilla marina ATCC 23134 TaxID=313606 RepID=A1ZCZ8_MICM2|nr:DUF1842 domain-containing protein [Microscilla marina]EAY31537.1 hypothetical protein M23134_05043 [Microscilla marina ATCC 23134]
MHTATKAKKNPGLFVANYEVRSNKKNDPKIYLCLTFYIGRETVIGNADINRRNKTFVSIPSYLKGDFTYISLLNYNKTQVLVTADGFLTPDQSTFLSPNTKVRLLLDENWEKGTASIKFQDSDGSWQKIENATIQLVADE